MINIEIDLTRQPQVKNTPLETKRLKSVSLTYEDDSILELEVIDGQAVHTVNEYGMLTTHSIFLAYGETVAESTG